MSATSLVTVVIPVHNGKQYLRETIDSVLCQTHRNIDLLVVDDGSTDETPDILASYGQRLRVINQANAGVSAARNTGVKNALGEFITFQDADDLWSNNKLALQLQTLAEKPDLDYVLGHMQQFICPSLSAEEAAKLACPTEPQPGYFPGTFMSKLSTFKEIGLLNPALRGGEFMDWYSRAQAAGLKGEMLPDVVMQRRLHLTNMSRTESVKTTGFAQMLHSHLQRKRAAAQQNQSQ